MILKVFMQKLYSFEKETKQTPPATISNKENKHNVIGCSYRQK
jgi:hypothetical protein